MKQELSKPGDMYISSYYLNFWIFLKILHNKKFLESLSYTSFISQLIILFNWGVGEDSLP